MFFFLFAVFCKPTDVTMSDLLAARFIVQFLSRNFAYLKKEKKRFQTISGAKNFKTLFLTLWANKIRNKKKNLSLHFIGKQKYFNKISFN